MKDEGLNKNLTPEQKDKAEEEHSFVAESFIFMSAFSTLLILFFYFLGFDGFAAELKLAFWGSSVISSIICLVNLAKSGWFCSDKGKWIFPIPVVISMYLIFVYFMLTPVLRAL